MLGSLARFRPFRRIDARTAEANVSVASFDTLIFQKHFTKTREKSAMGRELQAPNERTSSPIDLVTVRPTPGASTSGNQTRCGPRSSSIFGPELPTQNRESDPLRCICFSMDLIELNRSHVPDHEGVIVSFATAKRKNAHFP